MTNYKEELLNNNEFKNKYNDFHGIKSKNIKKGKDNFGNFVFISPSEKYILYPPKYKELYQYVNELINAKLELINSISLLKNMLINDQDNNDLKKEFEKKYNEFQNNDILINNTLSDIDVHETDNHEYIKYKEKSKSLQNDLDKIIKERSNETDKEKLKDLNKQIIDLFNKTRTLNKQATNSKSDSHKLLKTQSAYVRYYTNLDISEIKVKIN